MSDDATGLDTSGQFHIGNGISLAVDGPYIRIMSGRTRQSVRVFPESLGKCLGERYFHDDKIIV